MTEAGAELEVHEPSGWIDHNPAQQEPPDCGAAHAPCPTSGRGALRLSAGPELPQSGPAVVLNQVTVAYGPTPVLEGVHGTIEAGRAAALIGPAGAGKSTLLKAILGLAPVVRGSVTVLGRPPEQARRDVAYVPQTDVPGAAFRGTVTQVVLMGRYRRIGWVRRPTFADRAVATRALETVGLADRARDRFAALPGRQQQRVLLARAIAQRPRLLLVDEQPEDADLLAQAALLAALATMRSSGTSVVISTRNLALAHLTCDDVYLLNRRQFGFGAVPATLTRDALRTVLDGGTPQSSGLIQGTSA